MGTHRWGALGACGGPDVVGLTLGFGDGLVVRGANLMELVCTLDYLLPPHTVILICGFIHMQRCCKRVAGGKQPGRKGSATLPRSPVI